MKAKNRALLITVGMSPAVVTETLYALDERDRALGGEKPRTRLRVLTTESGSSVVRSTLLETRALTTLADERAINLDPVEDDDIVVFRSPSNAVADIRTPDDVLRMSDLLCEEVLSWCSRPDWTIHASISGGRKPMSMQLGFAMMMLGRPGDELSHVLTVPERPDECCERPFLYPTPSNPGSHSIDVRLLRVPILLLGGSSLPSLGQTATSYSEILATAQALHSPAITFDLPNGSIVIGDSKIPVKPAILAPYAWAFLKIARGESIGMPRDKKYMQDDASRRGPDGMKPLASDSRSFEEIFAPEIRAAREVLAIYEQLPHAGHFWKALHPLRNLAGKPELKHLPCLTKSLLSEARSKAKKQIIDTLEAREFARPYELTEEIVRGEAPPRINAANIRFIWDDEEIGRALLRKS